MLSTSKRLAALALLLGLVVALSAPLFAQPQDKDEAGFVTLFNGKDLTGWVYKSAAKESLEGKKETPDGRFVVKDGAIVALAKDKADKGGIKDLYTIKEFNDPFILRLQFKAAEKADSGVYLRGTQQQIRDFPRRNEFKNLKNFKNDDWNDLEFVVSPTKQFFLVNGKALDTKDKFELVVEGGKAVAKLNGKEINTSSYQFKEGPESVASINGDFLEKLTIQAKGGIGLQAETGEFAFRKVRVKELKAPK